MLLSTPENLPYYSEWGDHIPYVPWLMQNLTQFPPFWMLDLYIIDAPCVLDVIKPVLALGGSL